MAAAQGILARFRQKRSPGHDEEILLGNISGQSSRLSSPVLSPRRPSSPDEQPGASGKKLTFNIEDDGTSDDETRMKESRKVLNHF